MTPHNEAVRGLLRTLSGTWTRAYGATPEAKQQTLTTWTLALAGIPASVLPEVAQRLVQTSKYPPKPAEAIAIARTLAPREARAVGYSPAPDPTSDPDVPCTVPGCGCGPLVLARYGPGGPLRYAHRHELGPRAEIVSEHWDDRRRA